MTFKDAINDDLLQMWDNNFILRARELNNALGREYFDSNCQPMHFTGNPASPIVMVMLNPGNHNPGFNFFKDCKAHYKSFNEFARNYFEDHRNFGLNDKNRLDNFDLKQAAFLSSFDEGCLKIPPEFWLSKELKLIAKQHVLMNKYQVELVPFCSVSFTGLLDTPGQAGANFPAFQPFLELLIDEIFSHDRKKVVFCSKQFGKLFRAASVHANFKNVFTMLNTQYRKEGNLTLSCTKLRITYNGKTINSIIANSFPSRALPNAYRKMTDYGQFCYNMLIAE